MFELIPFERHARNVAAFDPFRELDELERSFFGNGRNVSSFRTDVTDTGDAYKLEAELAYTLLERGPESSLVRVALHTGRSHQIRVQFASRSMPLLGDVKYGSRERRCTIALWSCRLAFPHPATQKPMDFTALPPAAFPWDCFSSLSGGGTE